MTENHKIEAEKQELNLLVNRGISFEVDQITYKRRPGFFGRFKKRVAVSEKVRYEIKEPTLSTLDRVSELQIKLEIDEKIMSSENGVSEAKKLVNKHGKSLARIVALMVLGQDYVKAVSYPGFTKYKYDDKRLEELTNILFMYVKPSKLMQLTLMVNTMSNLGDFTNSIRLMSGSRTTMPIRIEDKEV